MRPNWPKCPKGHINQLNEYFMKQIFTTDRIVKAILFAGLVILLLFAFSHISDQHKGTDIFYSR